jgi:hypothetical protein
VDQRDPALVKNNAAARLDFSRSFAPNMLFYRDKSLLFHQFGEGLTG